ncbi:MAG: phosphoribosyl-ATP diphosphatase [Alphaproteobacteria bacterium]|nr:phosphoribosyl-ATP diphosphatase [Alphaproteobacteria bacterium]
MEILARLASVIRDRAASGDDASYTAKLLAGAPHLPAKKLAEEAVELALAAVSGDQTQITAEAADVLYHLLVLLQASGLSLADVCAVLAAREGVSGIAEKAGRRK